MMARKLIRRRVRRVAPVVRRMPDSSVSGARAGARERMQATGGLMIGGVHDPAETAAERLADRVMRMPEPAGVVRRACAACTAEDRARRQVSDEETVRMRSGATMVALGAASVPAPTGAKAALGAMGPGRPLPRTVRAFFEPRFGADFSRVRVHDDAAAGRAARALHARAFTLGHDIAFAPGARAPDTPARDRLMAHELAHVIQQRQEAWPELQRSALNDYNDRDVMHDPSQLTDAQIEATKEFKSYMDSELSWQWQHHMTREEALLACRLILRRLREGRPVDWKMEAADFMIRARRQLGTLREAEKLVGKLEHVHLDRPDFESPETSGSNFVKWLLADGPEPTNVSKMNCWEMVLFAAFRGNVRTKANLKRLYKKAHDELLRSQNPVAVLENELCGESFNLTFAINPRTGAPSSLSPEPLPGDIIVFNIFETHVAIALGTKTRDRDHLVISLHQNKVERTTIEDLIPRFIDPVTRSPLRPPPTLCRDPWRGK